MLGLLYSHVDPSNSLVCACLSLLSEGQWIRTPYTCSTQLAGHCSGAPHSCQGAGPAWFIIVSEFCISGLWGQKLMLMFWVTSCFTVRKFQLDGSIFMNWFKFWHCTWVPTRYGEDSQCLRFKSHTAAWNIASCTSKCKAHWVAGVLVYWSFEGYIYTYSKSVSDIVYRQVCYRWKLLGRKFEVFQHCAYIQNAIFQALVSQCQSSSAHSYLKTFEDTLQLKVIHSAHTRMAFAPHWVECIDPKTQRPIDTPFLCISHKYILSI